MINFLKKKAENATENQKQLETENQILSMKVAHYERVIDEIKKIAECTSKGDFSARSIHWDKFGDESSLLAKLNQSYDLADAFIREAGASLQAALKKQYHRQFMTNGMLGDMGMGANIINQTSSAIQKAEADRRDQRQILAEAFQSEVMKIVEVLASSAEQSKQLANNLNEDARNNEMLTNTVAAAAEQATANVQTVASACEELSASVQEIASQVAKSTEDTSDADATATSTADTIKVLSSASNEIGKVVNLINDIANQTNLLALNATIEAARAGEAGKGFAVVASEVKNLAGQTSTATEEISGQVSDIQSRTNNAVEAVNSIQRSIGGLKEVSSGIAAATEEQSAATNEISRNIQEAAQGTMEVSQTIAEVSLSAKRTLSGAQELDNASKGMINAVHELKRVSESFILKIQTG